MGVWERRRVARIAAFAAALGVIAAAVVLPGYADAATCALADGALDVRMDVGERITVMREEDDIAVRAETGEPCALVELDQGEELSVSGTSERDVLIIDLEGGPLVGGAEAEIGSDEIELVIDLNSGRRDRLIVRAPSEGGTLVAGAAGIALNDDNDVDILLAGVEQLLLAGGDGADVLSGSGGRGTGAAAAGPLILQGGLGDDLLTGGRGR